MGPHSTPCSGCIHFLRPETQRRHQMKGMDDNSECPTSACVCVSVCMSVRECICVCVVCECECVCMCVSTLCV